MATRQKVVETTVDVLVCDACGREAEFLETCRMCQVELCKNCYTFDDDYPYCPSCWKIGKPFRQRIADMERKHADAVVAVEAEWEEAATKARFERAEEKR